MMHGQNEISLYYDARSKKYKKKILDFSGAVTLDEIYECLCLCLS